jgi:hypothetical protein
LRGRPAHDHWMNSPSSGQHTAHYSPVIIATFVDQFIALARWRPCAFFLDGSGAGTSRFVKPDERIELLRQRGLHIVAQQLCIGPIDDADKPVQTRLQQPIAQRLVLAEPEGRSSHKPFAPRSRRRHAIGDLLASLDYHFVWLAECIHHPMRSL